MNEVYDLYVRTLLISLAALLIGCDNVPDRPSFVVEEYGAFTYKGQQCTLNYVYDSRFGSTSATYIRFIDCGRGIVPGMVDLGKQGLQ